MFHCAIAAFDYLCGSKFPIELNQGGFMINDGVQFAVVCSFFEIHPCRKESTYML